MGIVFDIIMHTQFPSEWNNMKVQYLPHPLQPLKWLIVLDRGILAPLPVLSYCGLTNNKIDARQINRRKTHLIFFTFFVFNFFFPFIFVSWRLITLQYCSGFCHTLTWISHGFTCIPHPDPPATSLSTWFLWVFPVHQAQALVSCIQLGWWSVSP